MPAIRRSTLSAIVLTLLAAAFLTPAGEAASSGRVAIRDIVPPSTPTLLRVTDSSSTSISMSWRAATDNVRVRNYVVSVDGVMRDTTSQTRFNFKGLMCGTAYTLGVTAVDTAGNRSAVAQLVASTSACRPPQLRARSPASDAGGRPDTPAALAHGSRRPTSRLRHLSSRTASIATARWSGRRAPPRSPSAGLRAERRTRWPSTQWTAGNRREE